MENFNEKPIDRSHWTSANWQEYAGFVIETNENLFFDNAYNEFWEQTDRTIIGFDKVAKSSSETLTKIIQQMPELTNTRLVEYAQANPKRLTEYFVSRLPNEAVGLKELLQERLRSSAPAQETAIVLRDNLRQAFAVVVDGKLQWLCSKTDVAIIMATLRKTLNMQPKQLARLAETFAPLTSEKWNIDSVTSMIKSPNTQGTLDAESASQAVLPYLVK